MKKEKFTLGLITALLTNSLIGCGGPNLKDYRPAASHSSSSPKEKAESNSQPVIVETESPKLDSADEPEPLPVSALVPVNVVSSVQALMSIPTRNPNSVDEATTVSKSSSTEAGNSEEIASNVEPTKQIEVLIKERKFQTESKTGAVRVSFDDLDLLKVLNMEPVVVNADELMPDWLQNLNGKLIRIRGYMYPTFETEGIERFVLARDNQICCFGRDPKIYDLVQVDMKAGKTTNYIPATRAFDVVGTFRIKMLAEDGKPYGLYLIEQASVIDR